MRKIAVIVFIFIFPILAVCQSVSTPDLNKSMIPPAPEAAALGKYGILPVTLYTGMVNVSVPITEIKTEKLSLPVSLSYNNNGYRPSEEASWVGLGWSLQAGGVITRVVKGLVDEYPNTPWTTYANPLDFSTNQDFLTLVSMRQVDLEPDLYIYNFNGHSGKFIMVGNHAFLLPKADIQITKTTTGFNIVAEDGVKYNFNDKDTTFPNNSTNPGSYMPQYVSAWYLSNMISADNADTIGLQYTSWSYRQYASSFSETYTVENGSMTSIGSQCLNGSCDTWTQNIAPGAYISSRRLISITSRNQSIQFIPEGSIRLDYYNSTDAYALKQIDIYSQPNNRLIKRFKLNHGYFYYNTTATQLKLSSISLSGYYVNQIIGNTGTVDSIYLPNYYSFQYYNENGAFPKQSKGIDKWGYYNGNDNNQSLFDATITPYTPKCPISDRSINTTYSINGVLQKVIYPTGGYSIFNYQGSMVGTPGYHTTENSLHTGQLLTYQANTGACDSVSGSFWINEPQTLNISYSRDISNYPNGVLNNYNILKIFLSHSDSALPELIYTAPLLGKTNVSNSDVVSLSTNGTYIYKLYCESTSINSVANIDYKNLVTSYDPGKPGPGLHISSIQSFDNINNSTPALTKIYNYSNGTVLNGFAYGTYNVAHNYEVSAGGGCYYGSYVENVISSDWDSPLGTLIGEQMYYPTVTEINNSTTGAGQTVYTYAGDGTDALGIYLTSQTEYSNVNNQLVQIKKTINSYTIQNYINFWGFSSHLSESSDGGSGSCPQGPLPVEGGDTSHNRYKRYGVQSYALSSNFNKLVATDDSTFDQNGQNPMVIHTDYFYDNADYLRPLRTVVKNSKGNDITTQMLYPGDYALTSCTSRYSIDTIFKSARDAASITYQLCSGSTCQTNYQNSYATIVNTLNTNSSNYTSCINTNGVQNSSYSDAQKAIAFMQGNNIKDVPVEQIVSINKNGNDYLFAATKTDFSIAGGFLFPKTLYETKFSSTLTLKSSFLSNPSAYYLPRVNFTYDLYENIIQQSKYNDLTTAYLWDYNKMYPIAQVSNANLGNIAYTSFESNGSGNWTIPSSIRSSGGITGGYSYNLSNGSISTMGIDGLDASKTYIVSYWAQTGATVNVTNGTSLTTRLSKNGWTNYEVNVTGLTTITISGSGNIDEVKLFPQGSLMTTYTYDPIIGLTSQCNPNNTLMYYEYDPLGRLRDIKDQDGNIIKTISYHFTGQ